MPDKLPPVVLVVEPDQVKCNVICDIIECYWFKVIRCYNLQNISRILKVNKLNIVIISSLCPNPTNIAKEIYEVERYNQIPIIFILHENSNPEKYILNTRNLTEVIHTPITANNLMPLIKLMLRNSRQIFIDKIIKYKNLVMNLATYQIYQNNIKIKVSPTEFKILELLVGCPNTIFSRQQIIDYVWGVDKNIYLRTVDVHINRLRKSIKTGEDEEEIIKTIRSRGYCLNLPGQIDY